MRSRTNPHAVSLLLSACLLGLPILAEEALPDATEPQPGGTGTEAVLTVPAGDAAALIAAINTANGNGQSDTIVLTGGTYSYTRPTKLSTGPTPCPPSPATSPSRAPAPLSSAHLRPRLTSGSSMWTVGSAS